MKKSFAPLAFLLLLVSPVLFAADVTGGPGVVSRGDLLKDRQYRTNAALNLFVDTTGADTNACTASGANACLTIQGALNKVPKLIRHPVLITVGSGNFAGAYVDGFAFDIGSGTAANGAYLEIDGTLTTFSPATGTATGTAASGTAGTAPTFGTLTDGTQTWTVNNLRGQLIEITGGTGSGQFRIIDSNTATAITIVGTWTAPTGTSTYTIHDWGTVINSGVVVPKLSTINAAGSTQAAFRYGDTPFGEQRGTLRWMKMTTANGVDSRADGHIQVVESNFSDTSTCVLLSGGGNFVPLRNWFNIAGGVTCFSVTGSSKAINSSSSNLYRGSAGTGTVISGGSSTFLESFTTDAFENLQHGIRSRNVAVSGSVFNTITGNCIDTNQEGFTTVTDGSGFISASSTQNSFTSCGIAVNLEGPVVASVDAIGSSNTTIFNITNGGHLQMFSSTNVTGTTAINLDGTTYTFATLRGFTPKQITDMTTLSTILEP